MSHIVIDARLYSTSTGRYISRLLQYLEEADTVNRYTILLKSADLALYQPTNSNFRSLASDYKEFTFGEQLGLWRQIRGLKPDLVHFTVVQQPVLYHGKTVTTMHDLITVRFDNPAKQRLVFKLKQLIYAAVNKYVAKKSNIIITPTDFVRLDVAQYAHVDPSKITVTYEAADMITDSPDALLNLQNQKFIMYIGRPTPHKNLARLIEAFALLHKQHPNLHLVLAGKTDTNYQRIANALPAALRPSVIFTDFISEGQLRWLYEHCQAYIFPSLSEGFGLPGLEAMVHGAPVVSSNASCLPEVYGKAAHYFDPLNVQAMATAINDVLSNDDLRKTLIKAGKLQATRYSWQRTAEQTLAIYQQLLY